MIEQDPRLTEGPTFFQSLYGLLKRIIAASNANEKNIALKANIDSPTFTGDPKAPTPLATDNDTSIATTAWCKLGFVIVLGGAGYIKLPSWMGSLIFQWGAGNINANTNSSGNWWGVQNIVYPVAFPSASYIVLATAQDTAGVAPYSMTWNNRTLTGVQFQAHAAATTGVNYNWFAIGV